jgi:diacylglycerol kinase family enzyme
MKSQVPENIAKKFREAGAETKPESAHVITRRGKWVLIRTGKDKAVAVYTDRDQAIEGAKNYLHAGKVKTVFLHKSDGTVDSVQGEASW